MPKKKGKVVEMEQQEERTEALEPTMVMLKELQPLGDSLNILINTPGLTGQELYWGKRSLKQVERAMGTAREVSKELIDTFAKKDDDGNPIIDFEKQEVAFENEKDRETYHKELEVRFSESLEVKLFKYAQHTLMGTRFTGQVPDMELLVQYCGA